MKLKCACSNELMASINVAQSKAYAISMINIHITRDIIPIRLCERDNDRVGSSLPLHTHSIPVPVPSHQLLIPPSLISLPAQRPAPTLSSHRSWDKIRSSLACVSSTFKHTIWKFVFSFGGRGGAMCYVLCAGQDSEFGWINHILQGDKYSI